MTVLSSKTAPQAPIAVLIAVTVACGGGAGNAGRASMDGGEAGGGSDNDVTVGDDGGDGGNGGMDAGLRGTEGGGTGAEGGVPPPTCGTPLPAPTPDGSTTVVLQVDECAARHAISDDIYGITFFWDTGSASSDQATLQAQLQFAKQVRLPVNRLGGDGTTRYNWQVDSSNAGEDWYFMAGVGSATPTPGATDDAYVKYDNMVGSSTIITIPIIDYITKLSTTNCSYPSNEYPTQDSWNPYVTLSGGIKCGNGKTGGQPIMDTQIANHDIANTPANQKAWIQHLVSTFGSAANGGVRIYEMDNEPTGWPGVHFDVEPTSPTCQDVIAKTQTYASTVKSADPTALVLGPDDIPPADAFSCMGTTNGEAYLAAMATYEKQNGTRILDYYSMHYPGCCSGDPIANAATKIKTHLGWIAANYPGTLLGYDEYNWGANGDSSTFPEGILAVDGLGLFGSMSVDLASFWGLAVTTPTATAFELYRNYDGKGGAFGQMSIAATSSDTTQLHSYAAERSDGAVTIVVVNKTSNDVSSVISLSNHKPAGPATVYLFSSAQPTSIVAQPTMTIANPGNIAMTFPAGAAELIVIP